METTEFNSVVWHIERYGELNKSNVEEFVAYIRGLQKAVDNQAPEGCVLMTVSHELEPLINSLQKLNSSDVKVLRDVAGKFVRYNKIVNDE